MEGESLGVVRGSVHHAWAIDYLFKMLFLFASQQGKRDVITHGKVADKTDHEKSDHSGNAHMHVHVQHNPI